MRTQAIRVTTIMMLSVTLALANMYPPVPGDLSATVPFDFIVGDQVLPAGEYTFRIDGDSGRVELCQDGIDCHSTVTSPVEAEQRPAEPQLAFRKYGDQHFLSQVWSTSRIGRHLPPSSIEPKLTEMIWTWAAVFVEARPLCIHENQGLGLSASWH